MTLAKDFVDRLACPTCRGPVALTPDGASLACLACRVRYAITDGIPDMIPEHALPLPEGGAVSAPR